jgi:phosphomevalonate kinase
MTSSPSSPSSSAVTVSACGKVLLVGGYLVLESPNVGLVLAVDKRFYTTIQEKEMEMDDTDNDKDEDEDEDEEGTTRNTTTTSESSTTPTTSSSSSSSCSTMITVTSPQFHAEWKYTWNGTALQSSIDNPSTNPFVEKTLTLLCLYKQPPPPPSPPPPGKGKGKNSRHSRQLQITIQADNDFYSVLPHLQDTTLQKDNDNDDNDDNTDKTTAQMTVETVRNLPKCLPCPIDETTGKVTVNKTGLGSSAALTTSLVGAWLEFFFSEKATTTTNNNNNNNDQDDDDDDVDDDIDKIARQHNLAQICHCWAQGKIGSGFDVSAAVYGTHLYRRFPICMLSDFLQQLEHQDMHTPLTDNAVDLLNTLVETTPWKEDMQRPLELPTITTTTTTTIHDDDEKTGDANNNNNNNNILQLVLADVCGGSESPSMAKAVLQWKHLHLEESGPIWEALQRNNAKVIELMQQLNTTNTTTNTTSMDYDYDYYDTLSKQPSSQWPTESPLRRLSDTFMEIRKLLKEMGDRVGNLPIEPDEQTRLCDATMALPGVVAAVVPGAGGYDAVACLYIDRPGVLGGIETLWGSYETTTTTTTTNTTTTNNGNNDKKTICPLGARVSREGLRVEPDWKV